MKTVTGLPIKLDKWPVTALEDLERSGLTMQIAEMAGFYPDSDKSYVISFPDSRNKGVMKSLKTGKPFYRRKILTGNGPKYLSEKDSGQRAFILPEVYGFFTSHPSTRIYLTEGEKKALRASSTGGLPCIGLTGNYGFLDSSNESEKKLLPELEEFARTHDNWCVVWDSDGRTNPNFEKASKLFAKLLKQFGCKLYVVYLPDIEGCKKVGIDDYLESGATPKELKKYIKDNAKRCIHDNRVISSKKNGLSGGRPSLDFDQEAATFIKARYRTDSGRVKLKYYRGRWFAYDGAIYKEISESALTCLLVDHMSGTCGTRAPNLKSLLLALQHPDLCGFKKDLKEPFNLDSGKELDGYLTFSNGDLIHPEKYLLAEEDAYLEGGAHIFTTRALGFNFDKDAKCPMYEQFLKTVHDDLEDIEELEKFSGYCLTDSMRFNKMLICIGPKGTGKSTFGLLMMELLGPYAATFEPEDFKRDVEKHKLTNCYVLMMEEVEGYLEEGVIKGCTGSGKIKYRLHYEVSREEEKTAKLIMTSNELKLKDKSGALLQDRMIISCFEKNLRGSSDQKADYHRTLFDQEAPGIFNHCLRGLKSILENERPHRPFKETPKSMEFKEEFARECNSSLAFAKDAFEFNPESFVTNHILEIYYGEYKRRLKDSMPDSLREFKGSILNAFPKARSGIIKIESKATRVIKGVTTRVDLLQPQEGFKF